ncbi:MAG: hypothetical protein U1F52_03825 [Burkholderiales bacterium]
MTKRHSALLGVIIASAVAGASPAATANVVLTSDAAFGANAVIRDVSHGRDFLRLDFTTPYTYNQVLAQLGGLFSGWTVASEVDMQALGTSAGITHGSTDPAQIAAAEQLRDWFCVSCVETSSTHIYARGLISDAFLYDDDGIAATPDRTVQDAFSIGRRLNVTPNEVDYRVSGFYYQDAKLSPNEGIFLTRQAVPEPDIKWLVVGAAGIALALTRRTRRRR